MNKLKTKLKLADRGSMLILAFTFVIVAPVYYANIRPQIKDSAKVQPANVVEPEPEQPTTVEQLPEASTVNPSNSPAETPATKPNKDKSASKAKNNNAESKTKPKNCSHTNREAGERYLQQLQQIRKDKQKTYNAIVQIYGLLSVKSRVNALNQDTYMKELNAYKSYTKEVRAAGCTPSGYNAP